MIAPIQAAELTLNPWEVAASQPATSRPTDAITIQGEATQEPANRAAATQESQRGETTNEEPIASYPFGSIEGQQREARNPYSGILPYGPMSLIGYAWYPMNDYMERKAGLTLNLAYTTVFQSATRGPGIRDGGSGDVDFTGTWRFFGPKDGPNNGYIRFAVEERHQIGDITPAQLSNQIGSLWKTVDGFNEEVLCVRDLFYEQHLFDDRLVLSIGKIGASTYYNQNYWANSNLFFLNYAFSNNPAMFRPGDGLGINARFMPNDWLYVTAGAQDAQGKNTTVGFNTLFRDFDLFSVAEAGLTPTIPGLGKGDYRFSFWHTDAVPTIGAPEGQGFALSVDQVVTQHIIPFFRYGYADGRAAALQDVVAGGVGYAGQLITKQDVLGMGWSWGRPSKSNLRDQWAGELFYRIQLSRAMQLTVGYQLIVNPSSQPDEGIVGIAEVRLRFNF